MTELKKLPTAHEDWVNTGRLAFDSMARNMNEMPHHMEMIPASSEEGQELILSFRIHFGMLTEPREPSLHMLRPFANGSRAETQQKLGVSVLDSWVRVEDLPEADSWASRGKGWGKISKKCPILIEVGKNHVACEALKEISIPCRFTVFHY
jgi:hypothetical protein